MADKVVLSKKTAARIARAVKRVESTEKDRTAPRAAMSGSAPLSGIHGTVTTAIPSGSRTSPNSSGAADLYAWDGSAWTLLGTFSVVNSIPLGASIAVGKQIKVEWGGGAWHLISAECP